MLNRAYGAEPVHALYLYMFSDRKILMGSTMVTTRWICRRLRHVRGGVSSRPWRSPLRLTRKLSSAKWVMIFTIAVAVSPRTSFAQQVTTLTLQADEVPTNNSFARWNGRSLSDMTSYSVCMYIKTIRARDSYDSVVSYAVSQNYNELYLGFNFPSGMMEVWWSYDLVSRARVPNGLLQWWRFCYLLDMKQKIFVVYWNDKIYSGVIAGPDKIRGGGIFLLGQDQDEMGGGFSLSQSFSGIIGDFRLYDRLLSSQEALDFVGCKSSNFRPRPVIDFSDVSNQWIIEGSTVMKQVSLADICEEKKDFLMMFPEPRLFTDSATLCNNLDGSLFAPTTEEENREILTYVSPYITQCKDGNGNIVQLGVKGDQETETYYYYNNGSRIQYHNLTSLTFIDELYCMGYSMTLGSEGTWYQSRCETDEMCTLCQFSDITYLKVRGLCTDSLFDSTFLLRGTKESKPEFQGFYYSMLQWTGEAWQLTYLPDGNTNATMIATRPYQYPLGRHDWLIRRDLCSSDETLLPLVFTTCKVGEYTCDDGSCINIRQRCDVLLDCPDLSDEANCNVVKIPDSYIDELPPQQPDRSAVVIQVETNITSIRAFSLLDLMIAFDVVISFTWRDSRLTYSNLKENTEMNLIGSDTGVWRPGVFYEEGSGSKVDTVERVSQGFIQRYSQPLPDSLSRLKEDEQYEGEANDLVDVRTLTIKSNCLFDLSMYPFDVQICHLIIRSTLGVRSVKMNVTGANFMGERRLLEYRVDDLTAINTESNGLSEVRLSLKFVNLYNYYISGTYVPTTFLLTITYLTLYFPLNDFSDRIMVSLTALLVLAALFLQTNQAMPRTAYLKLVDVWFVFCITVDFIIVLLLVIINYCRENMLHSVTPKCSFNSGMTQASLIKTSQFPSQLNTACRVLIPVGFLCFVIGYLIYTVVNWEG